MFSCGFSFAVFVALVPVPCPSPQPGTVVAQLTVPADLLLLDSAATPFSSFDEAASPMPPAVAVPAAARPVPNPAPASLPSGSGSLFDAVAQPFGNVTTTVKVVADSQSIDTASPAPVYAGGQDVLTSAGTHGDISRYLQLLPGVVSTSDFSNQMLVRGGHPMENLFLVDGIEIPNINHLANANTTGGFGPMIDAAAIQGLQFHSGGFEASYPERLSSVTEFHTLDAAPIRRHAELDFGIQGIGGLAEREMLGGDLLASAHHGLINLVSQNVGIDGVPSYSNALTRYRRRTSSGDSLTLLNVGGIDSIAITPCASDVVETSTINSTYRGWRETTGAEWQHVFSGHSFGVFNLSDSEQVEHIHQEDQILNPLQVTAVTRACPLPRNYILTTPVYGEDSNNAFTDAKYAYQYEQGTMAFSAGTAFWLQRPRFLVNQPDGAFSPYLETMVRADSASFRSNFAVGESGTYTQMLLHPAKDLSVSLGGRLQTFAFGDHLTLTPHLSASYHLGERTSVQAAYASYSQMPPYAYMLAYPINRGLLPMRATHQVAGMNFGFIPCSEVRIEAYTKNYRAIPASTEYPGVTLHTMVDMIGEQTVWLPMTTGGRGAASGIELSDRTRIGSRFEWQGSVAYSRARFAGLDGVLHPSNFDLPWIFNAAGVRHLGRSAVASARYTYTSGRPYTPFNMAASCAQNRPIYDLAKVNVPRAPYYSRLDLQVNREARVRNGLLELYCGVDNVLNRSNFLSYAWMPRYALGSAHRDPVGRLWQTPIFPNFGVRLILQ